MTPTMALALVGLGGVAVWLLTSPNLASLFGVTLPASGEPGVPGVTTNAAGRPFLDENQLNYYLSGFAPHLSGTQAAAVGAQAGAPLAGATFGISVGIGALAGWLSVRNSNDTREDREVFAKRLGFAGDGLGIHTQMPTSLEDKSKGLYSYLTFAGYDAIRHTAMAVIGRKDFVGNQQWMLDVLVALWQVNFAFPR